MTDESKFDELDATISRVISRDEFASTGDEELDSLGRLASGLRGLTNPHFKAALRTELLPKSNWQAIWPVASAADHPPADHPITSWFRGQRPFLVAGSSCGVVAGACCVSGFAAYVLGIAGAATVTAFIHNTIPYFVAVSIAGMLGWLFWMLREEGITFGHLALTLRRHGVALGSSYAAVFGASIAVTVATGMH